MHDTFPLADAAGAHRLMDSGEHIGKIVLEVG
ncbi:MAG TPA: zinc-binding dehydrogenase [Allosphingosinicella sp.]|nr:zinc-binding dehydrogenase [Allosphingosinicella sp.]